ncbi:ABC transporter ATP-binding protein [Pseudoalteromonas luteoviolacea]|uniref:ABC transporter ATP-binding protein n=1 Tax=Pseudoalteromonas luteoviolacea TaxID=43657 RepID=UPI001B35C6AD|nr:ABC transporter ATP-binding protein [Pseudoalteromonas luteoviolacea]MBQ4837113.1 ABC transporter ATP-binding protein [Pseudoalteromonas luteoviolacea]
MTEHAAITVEGLCHSYGSKTVLNELSFTLEKGKVYGILGANGAGKTTLINLLLGRLKPTAGKINILNMQAGSVQAKAKVGAMLQVGSLPGSLTVEEQLTLFASYHSAPLTIAKALRLCDLNQHRDKAFNQLSGGLKQRLLFAIAIIGNPEIVFLDEPSLAMDVSARKQMWQTIGALKTQGKTVLLTTHYMEEAEALSDELFILSKGHIVAQGSAAELSQSMQVSEVSFRYNDSLESIQKQLNKWRWQLDEGIAKTRCSAPNELLKAAFNAGLECQQLSVKPSSLEQTFMTLNKQEQAA